MTSAQQGWQCQHKEGNDASTKKGDNASAIDNASVTKADASTMSQ
jgi:hypothetical protein